MAGQTVEVGAVLVLSANTRAVIAVDDSIGRTSEAGEGTTASQTRVLTSRTHLIGAIVVVTLIADALRCVGVEVAHSCAVASCAGRAKSETGKAGIRACIAVGFICTGVAGTCAEGSNCSTDWAGRAV